ncbi:MAG: CoA-binding protein, partial [Thermodesulfobacteriota bacterium]|nr:CoA-binding protein [Thermodesulfobacteriota bacterium]
MIQQPHFLDSLFHPESIAIIGASANPTSKGYDYLKGMLELGFPGRIYPINMRAGEVLGLKAYPRIKDIPGQVDYVISCIDAQSAVATLADCALKGAKAIQLYTSGFSETGEADGIALERELLQRANDNGMHVIGPNCIGLHYPKGGLAFGRA